MNEKNQLSAFHLRLIAMVSMLCDHAAKTIYLPFDVNILLSIGRLAYPIFAYQLVEGYIHTRDLKKYAKRLFVFALISEIPYNLIAGLTSLINPFAQNVLWTMLIGIGVLYGIEKVNEERETSPYTVLGNLVVIMCGYLVATYGMVDYAGPGILTIVLFYYSRKTRFRHIIELAGMILINVYLLIGQYNILEIGGHQIEYSLQSLAVFALIPIWLYRGKQGYHSKWWSRFCYWFYPAHIVVLVAIAYAQMA